MEVVTLEGVVERGQIRLKTDIHLPDETLVYVVVPGVKVARTVRIASPRLAERAQVADFAMQVMEDAADAGL